MCGCMNTIAYGALENTKNGVVHLYVEGSEGPVCNRNYYFSDHTQWIATNFKNDYDIEFSLDLITCRNCRKSADFKKLKEELEEYKRKAAEREAAKKKEEEEKAAAPFEETEEKTVHPKYRFVHCDRDKWFSNPTELIEAKEIYFESEEDLDSTIEATKKHLEGKASVLLKKAFFLSPYQAYDSYAHFPLNDCEQLPLIREYNEEKANAWRITNRNGDVDLYIFFGDADAFLRKYIEKTGLPLLEIYDNLYTIEAYDIEKFYFWNPVLVCEYSK